MKLDLYFMTVKYGHEVGFAFHERRMKFDLHFMTAKYGHEVGFALHERQLLP